MLLALLAFVSASRSQVSRGLPGNRVGSDIFGAVRVSMGEGPYVLVRVQGTDADGLYCVRSKYPELPAMVYDPIEDDGEVVRVVVSANYLDEAFDEVVNKSLPVGFNTTKL